VHTFFGVVSLYAASVNDHHSSLCCFFIDSDEIITDDSLMAVLVYSQAQNSVSSGSGAMMLADIDFCFIL
jgi:hypothetical protein